MLSTICAFAVPKSETMTQTRNNLLFIKTSFLIIITVSKDKSFFITNGFCLEGIFFCKDTKKNHTLTKNGGIYSIYHSILLKTNALLACPAVRPAASRSPFPARGAFRACVPSPPPKPVHRLASPSAAWHPSSPPRPAPPEPRIPLRRHCYPCVNNC